MTIEPKLMSAEELTDVELDLFAPGPARLQIKQLLAHIAAQDLQVAALETRAQKAEADLFHANLEAVEQARRITELDIRLGSESRMATALETRLDSERRERQMVADRLEVATAANVADRMRMAELEAALFEASAYARDPVAFAERFAALMAGKS